MFNQISDHENTGRSLKWLMMHKNLTIPEKVGIVTYLSSLSRCNCCSVDLNTEVPNYVPSTIVMLGSMNYHRIKAAGSLESLDVKSN